MRETRRWRGAALALAGIAFTVASLAGCGHKSPTAPVVRTESSILEAVRRKYSLPGMAAAVIRPDSISTSVAGIRKVGSPVAVTLTDRFHIGSCTKAMTATVLGTLVEQGLLSWTSTPAQVFPELVDTIDAGYASITLEQLLSHRAGIPPYGDLNALIALPPYPGSVPEQRYAFMKTILRQPPASPVGGFVYSNAGYSIAAAMGERVSGQSWEALLTDRIFTPLGIVPKFAWPGLGDPNQPWGHTASGSVYVPQDPNGPYRLPAIIAPAGDLSLSIREHARFVQLHLRGLLGHDSLVTAATFTRLHTPIQAGYDYALGWGIGTLDGVPCSFHEGSAGTFDVVALIEPSRGLAVVVAINAQGPNTSAALIEATQALLSLQP